MTRKKEFEVTADVLYSCTYNVLAASKKDAADIVAKGNVKPETQEMAVNPLVVFVQQNKESEK